MGQVKGNGLMFLDIGEAMPTNRVSLRIFLMDDRHGVSKGTILNVSSQWEVTE